MDCRTLPMWPMPQSISSIHEDLCISRCSDDVEEVHENLISRDEEGEEGEEGEDV